MKMHLLSVLLFSICTCYGASIPPQLSTKAFFSPPVGTAAVGTELKYPLTYTTHATLPTTDDYLYFQVNSVSFFTGTDAKGECTGTEQTLDLSSYNWANTGLRFGNTTGTLGRKELYASAINSAADALGVTLANGNCVEVNTLYRNGNSSAIGDNIINTVSGNPAVVNSPFVLGNITVDGSGNITGGTPEHNMLNITDTGNADFRDCGGTSLNAIKVTSGLDKTITLANTGYGALSNLKVGLPINSPFANQFDNNTCNAILDGQGTTCTIAYNGNSTVPGRGALEVDATNGSQPTWILPFHVQHAGQAQCWGNNSNGQLGVGDTTSRNVPTKIPGMTHATNLVEGGTFGCALLDTGKVACWGNNAYGQLGDGNTVNKSTPTQVNNLSTATDITAGDQYACAVLRSGAIQCWGRNTKGQLGNGSKMNSDIPVQVNGLTHGVVSVAAGASATCALLATGAVQCWGSNNVGQLGIGLANDSELTPQQVSGLTNGVVGLSVGDQNACALLNNGAVMCWGDNTYGQLGNGASGPGVFSTVPVPVSGLSSGVIGLSSGYGFNCALMNDGRVKCWGNNAQGELGDGTTTASSTPVSVSNITDAVAISTGNQYACALLKTGSVMCWGDNAKGQFGDGTTMSTTIPVLSQASHAWTIDASRGSTSCSNITLT